MKNLAKVIDIDIPLTYKAFVTNWYGATVEEGINYDQYSKVQNEKLKRPLP